MLPIITEGVTLGDYRYMQHRPAITGSDYGFSTVEPV